MDDEAPPITQLQPVAAFDVFPDGRAVPADSDAPLPADGAAWRWLHIDLADPGFAPWCDAHLDDLPADALMQSETRPRADFHGAGVILNLRGVNLNPDAQAEDMVSLRLWITETLVVSARHRKVFAVDTLRQKGLAGHLPASPALFLARLIDGLTDRIEEVSLALEDDVDALEEIVMSDQAVSSDTLSKLRLKSIRLRRYIGPQREALAKLSSAETPALPKKAQGHIRESFNRTARAVEELDAVRDRLAALQDHLDGLQANAITRNGNILSIVAAIFLPLGFLTGLFGMNVAGLPGTEWPLAFVVLTLAMVAIGVGLYVLFRWLRWF